MKNTMMSIIKSLTALAVAISCSVCNAFAGGLDVAGGEGGGSFFQNLLMKRDMVFAFYHIVLAITITVSAGLYIYFVQRGEESRNKLFIIGIAAAGLFLVFLDYKFRL